MGTDGPPARPLPPARGQRWSSRSPTPCCPASRLPPFETWPSPRSETGETQLLSPPEVGGPDPFPSVQLAAEELAAGDIPRSPGGSPGQHKSTLSASLTSLGVVASGGCASCSATSVVTLFENMKSLFSGEKLSACGTADAGGKLPSGDQPEGPAAALPSPSLTGAGLREGKRASHQDTSGQRPFVWLWLGETVFGEASSREERPALVPAPAGRLHSL